MRLRARWLARLLLPLATKIANHVPPDFSITKIAAWDFYLKRWFVWKKDDESWWRLYLHEFIKDDDAAKHDHPYWSWSLVLSEGLIEFYNPHPDFELALKDHLDVDNLSAENQRKFNRIRYPRPGDIIYRSSKMSHQLCVMSGTRPMTLFFSGPRLPKVWGFFCRREKVPFDVYTKRQVGAGGYGTGTSGVGIGCGEEN